MAQGDKPPASRLGRTVQLARLATGTGSRLAFGLAKRAVQGGEAEPASEAQLADHRKAALHAVKVLGNMKGLAMKAGQILSYVDDWMPDDIRPAYQEVLSSPQAKAAAVPLPEVLNVFVDEVGAMAQAILENARDGDVVLCMGAGSIGAVAGQVIDMAGQVKA